MTGKASVSCCGRDLRAFLMGLLVRLLFALHAGACVVRILDFGDGNSRVWPVYMYIGTVSLMLLDSIFCHCVFKKSWKFFSPTIALYTICTAVCMWWMQMTVYKLRRSNGTDFEPVPLASIPEIQLILPLKYTLPEWCDILAQLMMFILIIGRWLLPKGKLSRDQLSQLLLVQVGIAADILELLSEGFSAGLKHAVGASVVLTVWSWSLPQFAFSSTATKRKKPKVSNRVTMEEEHSKSQDERDYHRCRDICCATELWSIFLSLLMQDVPFLALRLYIYCSGIAESYITPQTFFFACKNAVVILLQVNRAAVIISENHRKKTAWKVARKKARSKMAMTVVSQTTRGDIGVWYTQQAGMYPPSNAGDTELNVSREDVSMHANRLCADPHTDRV